MKNIKITQKKYDMYSICYETYSIEFFYNENLNTAEIDPL
jgi:hypothetical protein